MNPLRIACDFTDTIEDHQNVKPGYKLGPPVKDAVEALNKLKAQGAIIVIFSVWANGEAQRRAMGEWLRFFNVPYDFITNTKPDCDVYLDNKALRFETWEKALLDLHELGYTEGK